MLTLVHPVFLRFHDATAEQEFNTQQFERTRQQGRAAIVIGTVVYLMYGLLDIWWVPPDRIETVWVIRLLALCVPAAIYAFSHTPAFARHAHSALASVGLAAGLGLIGMMTQLPIGAAAYYYPGLVLATFYTYNFIGTRFQHALAVDLTLLLIYNVVFGLVLNYPPQVLATHDFFIIAANLIGGSAGYLAEYQRRKLFLRERELNNARQQNLERSLHDPLTGLPNRVLLHDRLLQAIAQAERSGAKHCGIVFDLDGFKHINARFGQDLGDRVLQSVAMRLQVAMRDSDTVSRLGGDRFFILAQFIESPDHAELLLEKLQHCIGSPITGLSDTRLSASIGAMLFPYPSVTPGHLIQHAEQAMQDAKHAGGARRVLVGKD